MPKIWHALGNWNEGQTKRPLGLSVGGAFALQKGRIKYCHGLLGLESRFVTLHSDQTSTEYSKWSSVCRCLLEPRIGALVFRSF